MSEHELRTDNQPGTDTRELVLRRRTAKDYMKKFKQRHPELCAATPPAPPDEKDAASDPATLTKAA